MLSDRAAQILLNRAVQALREEATVIVSTQIDDLEHLRCRAAERDAILVRRDDIGGTCIADALVEIGGAIDGVA